MRSIELMINERRQNTLHVAIERQRVSIMSNVVRDNVGSVLPLWMNGCV